MKNIEKLAKDKMTTIKLNDLVLNVSELVSAIDITRHKGDPDAVHLYITTKNGVIALIRYRYHEPEDTAECKVYRIKSRYNTNYIVVGSYTGDPDKSGLIDTLYDIIESSDDGKGIFQYDKDGFMRLKRRRQRMYRGDSEFGDSSDDTSCKYGADVTVSCHGIRDTDTEITTLVNAITLWLNKADVVYSSTRYPIHVTSRDCIRGSVESVMTNSDEYIHMIRYISNVGICDKYRELFIGGMNNLFMNVNNMVDPLNADKRRNNNKVSADSYMNANGTRRVPACLPYADTTNPYLDELWYD